MTRRDSDPLSARAAVFAALRWYPSFGSTAMTSGPLASLRPTPSSGLV
jgi:hypothetical protein